MADENNRTNKNSSLSQFIHSTSAGAAMDWAEEEDGHPFSLASSGSPVRSDKRLLIRHPITFSFNPERTEAYAVSPIFLKNSTLRNS
ncbi:hypothetical protein [Planomicrobium sp. YIM 101495]|uniref:hypothetical protein n=1 Tax=Planomicrobium sp. YIM 101495 TaxID=2665160 RepID=UPI0018A9B851|nr:hypothetical protein [Planomicrobium sp. YIM 101495]